MKSAVKEGDTQLELRWGTKQHADEWVEFVDKVRALDP